jgi:hypothetical protein
MITNEDLTGWTTETCTSSNVIINKRWKKEEQVVIFKLIEHGFKCKCFNCRKKNKDIMRTTDNKLRFVNSQWKKQKKHVKALKRGKQGNGYKRRNMAKRAA